LAKTRSVTLSLRHALASLLVASTLLVALTAGLYWLTLRFSAELRIPILHDLLVAVQRSETQKARQFVQQNLNAMAVRVGEMQAQLTRLDALGERLSTLAGIRPQEFRFGEAPGLGGAQATSMPSYDLSMQEFSDRLSLLAHQMENRTDMLGVLEAQLFEQTVKKKLTPTLLPVSGASFNASSFGVRIDPFTGQQAMHEGMDFLAETGTPVVAAAGGVVVFAGFHPQYGQMVELDHGNDLVTRYAHCSRLFVKQGDMLKRGRKIAEVGNTGRSTGSHLHFEVRFRGSAQNPAKFLFAANAASAPVARRVREN
jgi:murein DD-endopeptidase MepM/ murein hydrolase activator NlpD